MDKPEKYSLYEFYIAPIKEVMSNVSTWVLTKVLRYWWCEHCASYHSARVKKFTLVVSLLKPAITVCSIPVKEYSGTDKVIANTHRDLTTAMTKAAEAINKFACTMRGESEA